MNDRLAFLRAIRKHPDDDTARLAFADWLDEHDEPLGEFIRVQVELEPIRYHIDDPRALELHWREDELLRVHGGDWVGTDHLLTNPADFGPVFRRGLPDYACLSLDTFLANGEALFDTHPTLREVALYGVANRCSDLTMSPLLARLDTLEIADWMTEDDAISLSVAPHLDKIARFKLWLGDTEPYFLRELVKQAGARWPREIELVQVCGGVGAWPESPDTYDDEADSAAYNANKHLGRDAVRVTRPFERLFPLNGELGSGFYAGHLPDGTPALVEVGFTDGSAILATFNAAGGIRDVVRSVAVRALEGSAPNVEQRLAHDNAFREWVSERLRLELGLIWVREFAAGDLGVSLWSGELSHWLAGPERIPSEDRNGGRIRGWLEHQSFVLASWNFFHADWRGKIHSS